MNSIIKHIIGLVAIPLLLCSCIIRNPQPEDCINKEIVVKNIEEGSSFDLVFTAENGDTFYINRGLEQGLDMEQLDQQVLNKNVNLQLYKFWFGTSKHIAQITVDNQLIYTEFD